MIIIGNHNCWEPPEFSTSPMKTLRISRSRTPKNSIEMAKILNMGPSKQNRQFLFIIRQPNSIQEPPDSSTTPIKTLRIWRFLTPLYFMWMAPNYNIGSFSLHEVILTVIVIQNPSQWPEGSLTTPIKNLRFLRILTPFLSMLTLLRTGGAQSARPLWGSLWK